MGGRGEVTTLRGEEGTVRPPRPTSWRLLGCCCPNRALTPQASHTDALIKDINHDKLVALNSVSSPSRPAYASFQDDPFFFRPSTLEPPIEDPARPRVKPGDETGQDGEA